MCFTQAPRQIERLLGGLEPAAVDDAVSILSIPQPSFHGATPPIFPRSACIGQLALLGITTPLDFFGYMCAPWHVIHDESNVGSVERGNALRTHSALVGALDTRQVLAEPTLEENLFGCLGAAHFEDVTADDHVCGINLAFISLGMERL